MQQRFFQAAQKLSRHCGGHRARRENIHLTLAFLGAVAPDSVERAMAVAAQIQCSAFALEFDRLGWWQQNQVAWAAPSATPRPLLDLYKALQLGLVQEGFKFDERRFLPHVTLLRKAKCPGALIHSEPLSWRADHFVLVRSTLQADGAHYALLKRWALAV